MQIEEYLDFHADQDIRLRGTRVGIETILLSYLDEKRTAEEIAEQYPSVSLEQIYGAILYYLHYREEMDAYLDTFTAGSQLRQERQDAAPSPLARRLREVSSHSLTASA